MLESAHLPVSKPARSRWYQSDPLIVLSVVLFPPVGLTLMWRYSHWHNLSRSFALGWGAVYLILAMATLDGLGRSSNAGRLAAPPAPTSPPTRIALLLPTAAPTAPPPTATAPPTVEPTSQPAASAKKPKATATAVPAPVWVDTARWLGRTPADFDAEFGPPSATSRVAPGSVESAPGGGERRAYSRDFGSLEVVFDGGKLATGLYTAPKPVRPRTAEEALQLLSLPADRPPTTTSGAVKRWDNLAGQTVILTTDGATGEVKEIVVRQVRGLASTIAQPSPPAPAAPPTRTPAPKATATPKAQPTATAPAETSPPVEVQPALPPPAADVSNTARSVNVDGGVIAGDLRFTPQIGSIAAPDGKEYLIMSVAVGNFSTQSQSYNRFDFRLETPDGSLISPSVVLNLDGQLQYGDLAPGATSGGYLPFVIPRGERNLTLLYSPPCGGLCPDRRLPLR